MKWLNSLDELLYEVMAWLIFFPLTLWRALVHPLAMIDYADRQLALPQDDQYAAAVSPPLFLALALLLAHGIAIALGQSDALVANRHALAGMIDDETSALALRVVIFASFPLFAAARLVHLRQQPLDRQSLRLPFYAQCYPTAVFALLFSLAISLSSLHHPMVRTAAGLLTVASFLYFIGVETRWFVTRAKISLMRALGNVLRVLAQGFALQLFVGFLLTR